MSTLDLLHPPAASASAAGMPPPAAPVRPDTAALLRRVQEMTALGKLGAARPLLAALRRLDPEHPRLAELEARLRLRGGDAAGACALLDPAIAAGPEEPSAASLYKLRVEARTLLGDRVGACQDAAEAGRSTPGMPRPKPCWA